MPMMGEDKTMQTGLLSDVPIPLAAEIVEASGGLSIDIGSALAKVIYRSNQEYKNGIRLDKTADREESVVHFATFPRNDVDGLIEYVKKNCDFKRDTSGRVNINCCGSGAAPFQKKLELELKARMNVLNEYKTFSKAFVYISKKHSLEEMVAPVSEMVKTYQEASEAKMKAQMEKFLSTINSDTIKFDYEIEKAKDTSKDENPHLPCILAVCGACSSYLLIDKDGSVTFYEGPYIGGQAFYGLTSYMTNSNDFKKITETARKGDGKSVDIWMSDLIAKDDMADMSDNIYTSMADAGETEVMDMLSMPMGKLIHKKTEDIPIEDLLHSTYVVTATLHLQFAYYIAYLAKVQKVFFCGNLFDNQEGQDILNFRKVVLDSYRPPDLSVSMHVVRNGGSLGCLGAFISPSKSKPEGLYLNTKLEFNTRL